MSLPSKLRAPRRNRAIGRFRAVRRRTAVAALVSGFAVLVSSCTVANSDSLGGSGTGLRVVLPEEPPTLEPCESSLTSTGVVVRSNITQPLIERNPKSGDLDPLLATGWKRTSDTQWTFTMRDGVDFQDGTAFNARDAAYSIERAVNSDLGCNVDGYVFGEDPLEVEAVDEKTLTVESKEPDPILPLRLSFVEIVPTSTSTAKKVRQPVGTGPYEIGRWDTGLKLRLDRNKRYWGKAPSYENVTYQWRAEGTVRAAMVTSDEADVALKLGPLDGAGDLGVNHPNNETTALRLTGDEPPLDDPRIRRAVNYALDKRGIVKSLFSGLGKPAGQLVPSGVLGHNPGIKPWPHDLKKAKSLVKAAKADGVPTGKQILMVGRNELFPRVSETAEVLQEQLTQAGLNIKLKMVDESAHLEYQLRPFVPDAGPVALLIQHGNQAGDAAFTVDQYMKAEGAQSVMGTKRFDRMIAEAGRKSGKARQDAYEELLDHQNSEVTQFAHIAHMTGVIALSPHVSYTPDSATNDEMRLADIRPAG